LKNKKIIVLNEFSIDEPKTKKTIDLLINLDVHEKKILVLTGNLTEDLILSMRNLPNIALLDAMTASAYDLLDSQIILIDQKGLEMLNDGLADK
jgi:large subunit ribosomal protein L4